jgi:hypothetical protein
MRQFGAHEWLIRRATLRRVRPSRSWREVKNVNGVVAPAALAGEALRLAAGGFGLGNPFAGVFDHGRAVGDQLARVDSTAVDGGLPGSDPA